MNSKQTLCNYARCGLKIQVSGGGRSLQVIFNTRIMFFFFYFFFFFGGGEGVDFLFFFFFFILIIISLHTFQD